MAVNIKFDSILCRSCKKPLHLEEGAFIRVKQCGHLHHEKCFLEGPHIEKVNKTMRRVLCPDDTCKVPVAYAHKDKLMEELTKKIEKLDIPSSGGIKYVSHFAIVMTAAIIALVVHASFIALGVGLLVSLPIAYFVGKKIDAYLVPKTS